MEPDSRRNMAPLPQRRALLRRSAQARQDARSTVSRARDVVTRARTVIAVSIDLYIASDRPYRE